MLTRHPGATILWNARKLGLTDKDLRSMTMDTYLNLLDIERWSYEASSRGDAQPDDGGESRFFG